MLAWAALLCLGGAPAQAVEGAAQVVDGQTLMLAGQRFHLQGVVAPALDQVCHRARKPYPCGRVARATLWNLAGGLDVTCTPVPGAEAADDALPASCTAGATNLSEGMVRSGWALADQGAGTTYATLQDEAREAGRGLWRSEFELPGAPAAAAQ
jgi:endonuclease YncB( thermonuclease family)